MVDHEPDIGAGAHEVGDLRHLRMEDANVEGQIEAREGADTLDEGRLHDPTGLIPMIFQQPPHAPRMRQGGKG